MKAVLCCLALLLTACASVSPQAQLALNNAGVLGQYKAGVDDGSHSRFSELYLTEDFRFVLGVTDNKRPRRVTGTFSLGPKGKDGKSLAWINLVPDAPFKSLPLPSRLYVTGYDSYQVLATQPRGPHFWQGRQPADYEYFNDDTSQGTPEYFKDVPKDVPVT